MKKFVVLISVLLVSIAFFNKKAEAQNVLDGIYVKEHVPARKPVPYHHLREADVMWSKRIWRMLDLREKINHPLYYPDLPYEQQPLNDRYSLVCLLIHGIENEGLVTYDPFEGDEFTVPIADETLNQNLDAGNDTIEVTDPETLQITQKVEKKPMKVDEVQRVMLKEEWYFDKQRSQMEVRIIGICPIRTFTKDGGGDGEIVMKRVFWAYYPSIRNLLANHEVFNTNNDAERRTFEDIFWKRRFSSYIYQKTNVYNNRRILDYQTGLDALLESEKIKKSMFRMEHDLWEF